MHHAAGLLGVSLCGQDASIHLAGAHTGEISAAMLKALGCRYGIVGHSERRSGHSETNAVIAQKASRLEAGGLRPIVCVGESLLERQSGRAESVIAEQVKESCRGLKTAPIIAYETVWAIGSAGAGRLKPPLFLLPALLGTRCDFTRRVFPRSFLYPPRPLLPLVYRSDRRSREPRK